MTMFANLSDEGSGPLLTRTPQGKLLALVEVPDNCSVDGDVGTMRDLIAGLFKIVDSNVDYLSMAEAEIKQRAREYLKR